MKGAIIGDLAAWTWEHDKDAFNKMLVSDDAQLSEYGAIAFVNLTTTTPQAITEQIRYFLNNEAPIDPILCKWLQPLKDYSIQNYPIGYLKMALAIPYAFMGWRGNSADEATELSTRIASLFEITKQDFFAIHSLPKLIWNLRNGMSKNESLTAIGSPFDRITSNSKYGMEDNLLGAIVRGWKVFYGCNNFTSTVHKASKSYVNPHLTAAIAGELAEAMYGCDLNVPRRFYSNYKFELELMGWKSHNPIFL